MLEIHVAQTAQELQEVARLRYEIYVGEMNRSQTYADHATRTIREPFDLTGRVIYAALHGDMVGTVRLNFADEGPLECEEYFKLHLFDGFSRGQISMTTKFMIRREARHHPTLAARLAMKTFELAAARGIRFDFIDTNAHLIPLYEKMGYRRYIPEINHPDYGVVTPLCLVLDDIEHLNRVNSLFRRIAKSAFAGGPGIGAEHFSRRFRPADSRGDPFPPGRLPKFGPNRYLAAGGSIRLVRGAWQDPSPMHQREAQVASRKRTRWRVGLGLQSPSSAAVKHTPRAVSHAYRILEHFDYPLCG